MHLYLDTTERDSFVVALIAGDKIVKKKTVRSERKHSEKLLKTVATLLNSVKKSIRDIAGIAVVKGPGSFTSLRIGIATANALGYGLAVPVVGISKDESLSKIRDLFNRNRRGRKNSKPPLTPSLGRLGTGSWKGGDLFVILPEYGREPNITMKK